MGKPQLRPDEIAALKGLENGADITSRALAGKLREIQQKYPALLTICKPMGNYSVMDKLPYFGVILTAKGRKAIR